MHGRNKESLPKKRYLCFSVVNALTHSEQLKEGVLEDLPAHFKWWRIVISFCSKAGNTMKANHKIHQS